MAVACFKVAVLSTAATVESSQIPRRAKVTTDAVQVFGGADYMKDFSVERCATPRSTRSSKAPTRSTG